MKKINPDMSVLDVLSACRETEDVFREFDEDAGKCMCCDDLFESVRAAAAKYRMDLDKLVQRLNETVENKEASEK